MLLKAWRDEFLRSSASGNRFSAHGVEHGATSRGGGTPNRHPNHDFRVVLEFSANLDSAVP